MVLHELLHKPLGLQEQLALVSASFLEEQVLPAMRVLRKLLRQMKSERYLAKKSKAEKASEWELEPTTLGHHLVVTRALSQLVLAPIGVLEQAATELLAGTDSNKTRWRYQAPADRITDGNYVYVTLGDVQQVDTTHKNKQGQMEEQFTRGWMVTLRVLEVDDHEQDNQKPLQDLFYRREKSIQKYGSENDIN